MPNTRHIGPEIAQLISEFEPAIEMMHTEVLRPFTQNARTHSKKQLRQIANSIREFGFTNPVLVDSQGGIIAGHGRVEAAKLCGFMQVPTIRLDHLSEEQKRAYTNEH